MFILITLLSWEENEHFWLAEKQWLHIDWQRNILLTTDKSELTLTSE